MNRFRALKYLLVFTLPALVYVSFNSYGWLTFAPMLEVFVLIPLLELFMKPDMENLSKAEEEMVKVDKIYDWLVYLMVPMVFVFIYIFCNAILEPGLSTLDIVGRTTAMGLICGAIGINVGHELGHRNKRYEQFFAKCLLLSSLYMHFFIEHNRGHHKNVSTPEDPASARYGEWVFRFWVRSIVMSYISAWRLEFDKMKKMGLSKFSLKNEMLQFQIIQLAFIGIIYSFFGLVAMLYFLCAALMGILLLETVNYIEHYGLQRKPVGEKRYERVMPHHSWNSNHPVGRLMLFELSRHSDHHYLANRKYQILRNHEEAPSMPTGYPGMMVLALFPPLWFTVMHRHMKNVKISA